MIHRNAIGAEEGGHDQLLKCWSAIVGVRPHEQSAQVEMIPCRTSYPFRDGVLLGPALRRTMRVYISWKASCKAPAV